MKSRFLILLAMATAINVTCKAYEAENRDTDPTPIPLTPKPVVNEDRSNGQEQFPKSPIRIPTVAQDYHTLYLYSGCDNTTLELYAEDETLVYSTYIPEGTEQIALPSDLTGVFELRIVRGSITFVAEIEL